MTAPMIYELLSQVSDAVGAVGKTQTNSQQGFKYRGIDDFLNACHPALTKHRVIVAPEVIDRWCEVRDRVKDGKVAGVTVHTVLTIRYTFYAPDGSSMSSVMCGEGADTADKSTSKAASMAYKYALTQVLCIPLADIADSDKDTPEMGATRGAAAAELSREDYVSRAKEDVSRQADMHRRDTLRAAIDKLNDEDKAALGSFCTVEDIPRVVGKMTEEQLAAVEGWLVTPSEADAAVSETVGV